MNILVTGGSGFIGTRLVEELLNKGHEVKIYDKVISQKFPSLSLVSDVRDKNSLIRACKGIDIIYNLAAEHADDVQPKSLYSEVNIGGAKNIVEAAKHNNVKKIIFTSSVAIYGLDAGNPDENFKPKPFNEYGKTKLEAEKVFIEWARSHSEFTLGIIRPAVVFGENNRGNVYNLINQVAYGKFYMIGDGKNKKSMGYVGNISSFLASMINLTPGIQILNFADKPDLSSLEIIDVILSALEKKRKITSIPFFIGLLGGYGFDLLAFISNKKFPISAVRVKKFTAETTIDTTKLIESGYNPKFTLEQGLRRMIKSDFF